MHIKKTICYVFALLGALFIMIYITDTIKLQIIQSSTAFEKQEIENINNENLKELSIEDYYKNITPFNKDKYTNGKMIIYIPKIKVEAKIMKDTKQETLKYGPGIYEKSPLPDIENGNVCIAGHRTTYGKWFLNVDKLSAGDEVILDFNGLRYVYKVERVFIIANNDWSVTEPTGYSALTLTSCHPLRSARQRIVVRARLYRIIDDKHGYVYENTYNSST